MATLDLKPLATGDDGNRQAPSSWAANVIFVGLTASVAKSAWLRFPGATIPVGATIDVAHITLTRTATAGTSVLSDIFGVDEDDHVAPTSHAEWSTDHGIHTTATVTWDFAPAASGTHQTPSLAAILQEIVDRGGWADGNAIGIHIDDGGTAGGNLQTWEDFVAAGTGEAVLHIEYTTGGGGVTLTGALFTKAPTFFTGAVTATSALTGTLFTKSPTFFTGTVTATNALTGTLFTKAPTFPQGVVTAGTVTLTGTLFAKAPTFFTGAVSLGAGLQTLDGVLFTKAPTFPTGTVTAGAVALTGVLFTKAPTFPTGVLTLGAASQTLTGTLFTKAPSFSPGAITVGAVTLNGTLFTKAPTFPQGAVTAEAVSLTGILFTKAPTFFTGAVAVGTVTLNGVLFQKAPTFPIGTIGQAGTLFGTLFVNTPVFFTGSLAQGGPSFWIPNPAGWTANPSPFVRVGPPGPSPWGTQLSGRRFEKAPTFPAGVVT